MRCSEIGVCPRHLHPLLQHRLATRVDSRTRDTAVRPGCAAAACSRSAIRLHALGPAPDVRRPGAVEELGDAGMLPVGGAEHRLRLAVGAGRRPPREGPPASRLPGRAGPVSASSAPTSRVIGIGHKRAVTEPHAGADGGVGARGHEPRQRREPPVQQQLEVAEPGGARGRETASPATRR